MQRLRHGAFHFHALLKVPGCMENPANCLSAAASDKPEYMVESAWIEHAPFAFWVVETHRPKLLVELGTHHGYSYFSFCQQVRRMGFPARCFAVDTWQGDAHAGFYGEDVFEGVRRHNDLHYADFSTLIRSTFAEAASGFVDGSIDLLHIDGRHYYDDVRDDFEAWRAKLSRRAIVLFHDTQVRERGFGVHRFWDEIRQGCPHFEFEHCYGLGVLGAGSDPGLANFPLFKAAEDAQSARAIQEAYARLGAVVHSQVSAELKRRRRQLRWERRRAAVRRFVPRWLWRDGRHGG
ncbi:MAG: class I SAM-dependent methyltransferase [Xanthobacteraceae bacterium]